MAPPRKPRQKCARAGCRNYVKETWHHYCGKSCRMKVTRAQQTPEQRSAMAKRASRAFAQMAAARLYARVRVLADSERDRVLLAYRYGLNAQRVRRYWLKFQVVERPEPPIVTGSRFL